MTDESLEISTALSSRINRAADAWEGKADGKPAEHRIVVEIIRSEVPVPVEGVHSFDVRLRHDRERLHLLARRLTGIVRSAATLFPEGRA